MTTPTMTLLAWAEQIGPATQQDISRAITVAQHAHRGQFRRSGDPYIEHPIAVALILAAYGADPETVITAVLHDLRDFAYPLPVDDLRVQFSGTIVDLLVAFTELDRYGTVPDIDTLDRRILQIKIADRLHNMRTIRHLSRHKQRDKSTHTHHVVAPLARTLGMTDLGAELDDLATSTLRACDAADLVPAMRRVAARPPRGVRSLHRALHAGAVLLPRGSRQRWLQDWDGELYAAASVSERVRFTASVLRNLPTLAITSRRRTGTPC